MADLDLDLAAVARIAVVPTILDVVCRATGMGYATVARVTADRWMACAVQDNIAFGLQPGGELGVETTICREVRASREPIIINEAACDEAFSRHPTPKMYGFQSYISVPIILPDGTFFGTLCAIDPRPRRLNTPEIIGMFKLFAELIAFHLDAIQRLTTTESRLSEERQVAALREQFVAVLGHDLRNPLAAIDAGVQLIGRTPLNDRANGLIALVRASVARIAELVDNILDFAQGRLGGGLTIEPDATAPLQPVLQHVVAELQAASPDRCFEIDFRCDAPVHCDRRRIGQMLSNLAANALTHGAAGKPILVTAVSDAGSFELSVSNAGDPIPPATLERLFRPFTRGAGNLTRQGLGLGLYICAEIARAHGGTLEVASTPAETRFTFRMQFS